MDTPNLYNNKCFVRAISDSLARNWACDSSLEPSWLPYEPSMGEIRFARAARPQRAKLCFLLHKAALNSRFDVTYVVKKHNFACCGRAARAKRIFPMEGSYGSQDGSNELSHAQFRARACEIARTKHLLVYRWQMLLQYSS